MGINRPKIIAGCPTWNAILNRADVWFKEYFHKHNPSYTEMEQVIDFGSYRLKGLGHLSTMAIVLAGFCKYVEEGGFRKWVEEGNAAERNNRVMDYLRMVKLSSPGSSYSPSWEVWGLLKQLAPFISLDPSEGVWVAAEAEECMECEGTGNIDVDCVDCDGTGYMYGGTVECYACDGTGWEGGEDPDEDDYEECTDCDGTGILTFEDDEPDEEIVCPDCGGTGTTSVHPGGEVQPRLDGSYDCSTCKGSGVVMTREKECPYCDGRGRTDEQKECSTCNGEKEYYDEGVETECDRCNGEGKREETCEKCDGMGQVQGLTNDEPDIERIDIDNLDAQYEAEAAGMVKEIEADFAKNSQYGKTSKMRDGIPDDIEWGDTDEDFYATESLNEESNTPEDLEWGDDVKSSSEEEQDLVSFRVDEILVLSSPYSEDSREEQIMVTVSLYNDTDMKKLVWRRLEHNWSQIMPSMERMLDDIYSLLVRKGAWISEELWAEKKQNAFDAYRDREYEEDEELMNSQDEEDEENEDMAEETLDTETLVTRLIEHKLVEQDGVPEDIEWGDLECKDILKSHVKGKAEELWDIYVDDYPYTVEHSVDSVLGYYFPYGIEHVSMANRVRISGEMVDWMLSDMFDAMCLWDADCPEWTGWDGREVQQVTMEVKKVLLRYLSSVMDVPYDELVTEWERTQARAAAEGNDFVEESLEEQDESPGMSLGGWRVSDLAVKQEPYTDKPRISVVATLVGGSGVKYIHSSGTIVDKSSGAFYGWVRNAVRVEFEKLNRQLDNLRVDISKWEEKAAEAWASFGTKLKGK